MSSEIPSFIEEIRDIGGIKGIIGIEFYVSLFFTVMTTIIILYLEHTGVNLMPELSPLFSIFLATSGALLGFVVAAFALTLSVGSDPFKKMFHDSEWFKELRIDFSLTAMLIGICAVVSIFGLLLANSVPYLLLATIFLLSMFFFLWGIMNIIVLITNSMRVMGLFS